MLSVSTSVMQSQARLPEIFDQILQNWNLVPEHPPPTQKIEI